MPDEVGRLTSSLPILQKPNNSKGDVARQDNSRYSSALLPFMLQAHSLLSNYLSVAPNVLLLILCFYLWKRGLHREFPFFFAFALSNGIGDLVSYAADVLPFVSAITYWRIVWVSGILQGVLKLAAIGEIFCKVFGPYASIARLGKVLIQAVGAVFVLAAAIAATYNPWGHSPGIMIGSGILQQSTFLIECGLFVFVFIFASYFHLRWPRQVFAIALGLSISACVHLATWGLLTNAGFPLPTRVVLITINGVVFHLIILSWFYYLLVPEGLPVQTPTPLPENNLALWNRELERLLQR
jgi:hypothetical protein